MKVFRHDPPMTTYAFANGNEYAHHWHIDVTGEEYLELVEKLKTGNWNRQVRWFPKLYASEARNSSTLRIHVVIPDDRDAMLFKLSL